jgi:SAM-dependent methyltransferase
MGPVKHDPALLRRTFNAVADVYETARPDYPSDLFDDLVELAQLTPSSRLLEVGCATGKATLPLLRRGFSVTCVELGRELAARAQNRFRGLPAEVHVAAFESWQTKQRFDLVFAATAWHWIDPQTRYLLAHRLLRPGGRLAFWKAMHAFPRDFDPFFTEIQQVYDELGEGLGEPWPPPPPEDMYDDRGEIEASGLFEHVETRRYLWAVSYGAEEYIALISTFSNHIAMAPEKRRRLDDEIRRRLARRAHGRARRHWCTILHVAQAVGDAEPAASGTG